MKVHLVTHVYVVSTGDRSEITAYATALWAALLLKADAQRSKP